MALTELALIAPLLLVVALGTFDVGRVFYEVEATRDGVREATRLTSLGRIGLNQSCEHSPTSLSGVALEIICMTKAHADLDGSIRVGVWFPSGSWTLGESVKICAQYQATSSTGVTAPFLQGRIATVMVEMAIQTPPPTEGAVPSAAETPLTNWPTSCTG